MNERRIDVGLIGCGKAARGIHWPLLKKHAARYCVAACADALPAAAAGLARDFGFAAATVEDLLAREDVELVVIVTRPPATHHALALQALAAGKHVVVEKPMAETSEECAAMVAAAERAGRVLAVHHNRRWDVDFLAARHALEQGFVGIPRLVRNEFSAGYARSAYDWGIHLLDQTMALSRGRRFVEITATVCRPDPARPTESEGFFSARLRTEDGVVHDVGMLPTVRGSAHRPGRMACRFLIAGTEGVVYQEWCQRPEDAVAKTAASETAAGGSLGDLPLVTASLAIPDFYEGLYRAVREGAPPPVSGAEGLRAVRAWELLCQSACENRTLPISL